MTTSSDKTLFQSVIKMVDSLSASGNYDTIIHILSLLCLFSILSKNTALTAGAAASPAAPIQSNGNPLQKILGELTKGDGTNPLGGLGGALGGPLGGALGAALGSPDMLMSLLPLLNNPQIKSKLNPANIASVMGMLNNIGGGAPATEKQDAPKVKPEKKTPHPEHPVPPPIEPEITSSPEVTPPKPMELKEIKTIKDDKDPEKEIEKEIEKEPEKKPGSRFLNWKTNF